MKTCEPTFFWRLIKFARCLLEGEESGSASALHVYMIERGNGGICVLEGLDRLDDGLVVVEGTVSVGERCALRQGNADARLRLSNGARGGDEGKSHCDQRCFAEHGEGVGESWVSCGP